MVRTPSCSVHVRFSPHGSPLLLLLLPPLPVQAVIIAAIMATVVMFKNILFI
jgi:hypothetical protein